MSCRLVFSYFTHLFVKPLWLYYAGGLSLPPKITQKRRVFIVSKLSLFPDASMAARALIDLPVTILLQPTLRTPYRLR